MDRNPRLGNSVLLVIVLGLLTAKPAYAYIDPNATNLLTQILTPLLVVAAAGVTFLRKQTSSAFGWIADHLFRRKK